MEVVRIFDDGDEEIVLMVRKKGVDIKVRFRGRVETNFLDTDNEVKTWVRERDDSVSLDR